MTATTRLHEQLVLVLIVLPLLTGVAGAQGDGSPFAYDHGLTALAFSRDGSRIVGGCPRVAPYVRVWDVKTGQAVVDFEAVHHVNCVGFSKDGGRIYAISIGGMDHFEFWDLKSKKQVQKVRIPYEGGFYSARAALSDDGSRFAWGGLSDRIVAIWNLSAMTEKVRKAGIKTRRRKPLRPNILLKGLDGKMWCSAFAPGKHNVFAVGTRAGTAILWNLETKAEIVRLKGHPAGICDLVFTPDGKRLVTAGDDGWVKVWDLATKKELASDRVAKLKALTTNELRPLPLTVSGNGAVVAARTPDGYLVWDVNKRKAYRTLAAKSLGAFALSYEGKRLVAGGDTRKGGLLSVWDVVSGKKVVPGRR
jgi:WD40 repeat protein